MGRTQSLEKMMEDLSTVLNYQWCEVPFDQTVRRFGGFFIKVTMVGYALARPDRKYPTVYASLDSLAAEVDNLGLPHW